MAGTIRSLSYEEKRDWIRLSRTSTVGPVRFQKLLQRYSHVEKALADLPRIITKKNIKIPSIRDIDAEMQQCDKLGIKIIAACEPDYPSLLTATDSCPPILMVWGNRLELNNDAIAIVGSRNASANGQRFARSLAYELGELGYHIVSGLARGIDTQAHHGSLRGGTLAVLGGGIDHIYPRQNHDLYQEIKEKGALISESPLGYHATARDFPRRNRIISGLSCGVIIVEAAERSGTLITARYALEQNREVMAVPGPPLDPRAKGCNRLIKQGAALIESAHDVHQIISQRSRIDILEPDYDDYGGEPFDLENSVSSIESAKPHLLALLSTSPAHRDEIIRLSQLPIYIANAALLELELNADIIITANGYIAINSEPSD